MRLGTRHHEAVALTADMHVRTLVTVVEHFLHSRHFRRRIECHYTAIVAA